jgi:hypothetical protein
VANEELENLIADLATEAAQVPGVDASDISSVLTSAAEDANGGMNIIFILFIYYLRTI